MGFVVTQERTRAALLDSLHDELQRRSQSMMGLASGLDEEGRAENGHAHGGLLESIKVSFSFIHKVLQTCFNNYNYKSSQTFSHSSFWLVFKDQLKN